MSVPDPVAAIVTLLRADTAVAALAGTRVYGGELPASVAPTMPQAAVVISPAGGPGRSGSLLYRRTRVDTTCYGATLNQAWQAHLAVREALETAPAGSGLLAVSTSSDGALARDPLKQWPTAYASYVVVSATET